MLYHEPADTFAAVRLCRTQETTLVHHVFGGYLRSQVICSGCGGASRRYEAALDLQLEVPPAVDRLEDALVRHTAGNGWLHGLPQLR